MPSGQVGVPLALIANCWLRYYWPIIASKQMIPQSNAEGAGGKPIKFRSAMVDLIDDFREQGPHGGLTAWYLEGQAQAKRPSTIFKEKRALQAISQTIVAGPVTYSGGSLDSGAIFDFDKGTRRVLVPAAIWRELVLMGHWISEAVIVRWANLSAKFAARMGVGIEIVLPLLLVSPEPARATILARKAFEQAGLKRCTWTGKRLNDKFVVDHAIPFSLWGSNDLWNLLQVDEKVNLQKSDKLPALEMLERRQEAIYEDWQILKEAMPTVFNNQATVFVGSSLMSVSSTHWKDELFAVLKQSIEMTAMQRGVARWSINQVFK